MLLRIMSLDLLVILTFRVFGGIFLAVVFAFMSWLLTRPQFEQAMLDSDLLSLVPVLIVGISGGLGAMLAWWNADHARTIKFVYVAVTLGAAMLSTWVTFQYARSITHPTFLTGIGMVRVIYPKDVVIASISAVVISGNVVGGVFYLYRALRHREV